MAKLNLKEERKYAKENKIITTHTRIYTCCIAWFHSVYSVLNFLYRLGGVRIGGNMKRGEIYYIENNNAVGSEQRGIRPAVIVGNDVGNKYSPVLLIVYFTSQPKKHLPTHVNVRGHGTALCEQIFTIDRTRLLQKKGECTNSDMERINKALYISLGLEETWKDERNTTTHRYSNERR